MAAVSKRRRMSPIRFVEVYELSRTPLKFAEQLGEWGVIPKTEDYPCPKCGQSLSLSADTNSPDGVQWYCGNTSGESVDRKRTNANIQWTFVRGPSSLGPDSPFAKLCHSSSSGFTIYV